MSVEGRKPAEQREQDRRSAAHLPAMDPKPRCVMPRLRTWQPPVLPDLSLVTRATGCQAADACDSGCRGASHSLYRAVKRRAKATLKELQSKQSDSKLAFFCIIFFNWIDKNSIKRLRKSMEYYLPIIHHFFSMNKVKKYFNCWTTKSE